MLKLCNMDYHITIQLLENTLTVGVKAFLDKVFTVNSKKYSSNADLALPKDQDFAAVIFYQKKIDMKRKQPLK